MSRATYAVVSETSEDRFDETTTLDEAVRVARGVAREGRCGDAVSIEHEGRVIRQFVLTPGGVVEEVVTR